MDIVPQDNVLFRSSNDEFFADLCRNVCDYNRRRDYVDASFFKAGDGRNIGQQLTQPFGSTERTFDEFIPFLRLHIGMAYQGFQANMDGRNRRFQFMVEIVCQFAFDAYFFLFLMERLAVFLVSVGYSLLEPCVQSDDIGRDFPKLIMRKRFAVKNLFSALGFFRGRYGCRCGVQRNSLSDTSVRSSQV